MLDSAALQILVELKDLTAAGFDKLKGNLSSVGAQANVTGNATSSLRNDLSGLVSPTMLAAGAATALVGVLGESIKAAIDDESSISLLTASLKANVPGWDGTTAAIEAYITSAEAASAFSKDDLRTSLEALVGATHNVAKAEADQATATNLARFKNIDLASATQLVVDIEAGRFRGLAQLGIAVHKGETAQQALNSVNAIAAGQDTSYLGTTAGRMDALNNNIHDLSVSLGLELLPVFDNILALLNNQLVPAVKSAAATVSNTGPAFDTPFHLYADAVAGAAAATDKLAADASLSRWSDEVTRDLAHVGDAATGVGGALASGVAAAAPAVHKALADLGGSLAPDWAALFTQVPNPMIAVLQKDLNKPGLTSKQKKYIEDELKGLQKTVLGSAIDLSPMIIPDSKRESMLLASIATLEANRAQALKLHDIPTVEADSVNLTKLITEYNALVNAETSNYGNGLKHMAAGGPVMAGVAYTIGERGSERFVPKTDGYILPHGAGGGQTVHMVQVFLDGKEIAANTAQHLGRQLSLVGGSRMYGSRL